MHLHVPWRAHMGSVRHGVRRDSGKKIILAGQMLYLRQAEANPGTASTAGQ
jgi:hypothetical protein